MKIEEQYQDAYDKSPKEAKKVIESIDYSTLTENEFDNLAIKVKNRDWSDYLAIFRYYNTEKVLNKLCKNCFKSVDFVELFKQYPIVADAKIGRIDSISYFEDEGLDEFTLNFSGDIHIEYNKKFYDTSKGWVKLDKYTVDIYIKNIDRFIIKFLTFKVSTLNFDEFKTEYIKALNTPSDAILEYMAKKELNDKGENIKGWEEIGLKQIEGLLNKPYDGLTEKERNSPHYLKRRNDFIQLKAKIEALMLKYRANPDIRYADGGNINDFKYTIGGL